MHGETMKYRSKLNNNKLINEKLICAFRWSVLSSITYIILRNWRPWVLPRLGSVFDWNSCGITKVCRLDVYFVCTCLSWKGSGGRRRENNLLMCLGNRIEILVPHCRRLGMEFYHKLKRSAGRRSPKCHMV